MTLPPYLTQEQVDEMTEPLTRPADQCRVLREMGFCVKQKPNGRPLVARSNFETVMNGKPAENDPQASGGPEPDAGALITLMGRKGVNYGRGKKTEKQPAGAA